MGQFLQWVNPRDSLNHCRKEYTLSMKKTYKVEGWIKDSKSKSGSICRFESGLEVSLCLWESPPNRRHPFREHRQMRFLSYPLTI